MPGLMMVTLGVMSLLIVGASLMGGWLPHRVQMSHDRMQLGMSFVGGLMLGNALLHLLPHAIVHLQSIDRACLWTLAGLLTMFFLQRAFHFHQHEPLTPLHRETTCGHDHDHDHDHGLGQFGSSAPLATPSELLPPALATTPTPRDFSWAGMAFGLSVHTLLDGVALAAVVQADASHGRLSMVFGLGTFLAIFLHKPLDSIAVTTLMIAQNWPLRTRVIVNLIFSLMCPLGAFLFVCGVNQFPGANGIVGASLGFSAGIFFCISMGDLLPEIEFHSHDRLKLSGALLAGVALALGLGYLEPLHVLK